MTIEHIGGKGGSLHIEIWGIESEIETLEEDTEKIEKLIKYKGDTIFLAKDRAEIYYLDKTTKRFKVFGE